MSVLLLTVVLARLAGEDGVAGVHAGSAERAAVRLPIGHLLQRLDRLPERRALELGEVLERGRVEVGVRVLLERVQGRGRRRRRLWRL